MNKCIVMLSGGLDSRLAVKIMQERGFDVTALFFKLPFGTGCCDENCSFNFSQLQGVELKVFDCTRDDSNESSTNSSKRGQIKGKLFQEYLEIVRNPKHRRGTAMNPCIDCRIFILKKAKEFADKEKIKHIVTGEVVGERPMSQMQKALDLIEEESGLRGRLIRPLCEIGIQGRRRDKQIELAKKFGISYPNPGGGCLLCEKLYCEKLKKIIDNKIGFDDVRLLNIGRHFEDSEIILGRNNKENKMLEKEKGIKIIPKQSGATALIKRRKYEEKAKELIRRYSKHNIKEFDMVD